jgi:hypothetical protein
METETGYVALLDVLGFTNLVSGERHAEKLNQYISTLENISLEKGVEVVLFSDSIVMTSEDDGVESLLRLLISCSRVFGVLLDHEIAVKGAIACGSFIRRKTDKGTFLAGRSIIEAYNFQQKQNWVGVMLAPSVRQMHRNLGNLCAVANINTPADYELVRGRLNWMFVLQDSPAIPFHVPGHEGLGYYEGFAVVPTDQSVNERQSLISNLDKMMAHMDRLKSLAPDPSSQGKYGKTKDWLRIVRSRWEFLSWQGYPEKS